MGRRFWALAAGAVSILFIAYAGIVRYHHALAVFLNSGQPTGCGGG